MTSFITSDELRIGVKDHGSELTSVKSLSDGTEYLWQGDTAIWYGQSPILFPIVGRLVDDSYSLDGKKYTLAKHGFARKTDFTLVDHGADTLTMRLTDSEETLKSYPYHFELDVTFKVSGRSLSVTHEVKNLNDHVMYFSLGAHPAFNCAIGDVLRFDEPETLSTEKIDLVHSLRLPEAVPVLNNETDITITKDIFNEDALILHGIRSRGVTLVCSGKPRVRFDMGGSPYLGIWAKPGAPYVCIEPWFGVNDGQKAASDLSGKDGICSLKAGDVFSFTWRADFS